MAQKHSSTIGRRINPKSNLQIHGPAFEKQEPSRANPSRSTPHNDNVESSLKIRDYEKYQQTDQNIANPELDLESTKKLVASLVSNSRRAKFPPIHKDDDGEVPCKDIETIFTSSKFKENSDLDVAEPFRSSAQILRFTGNAPVLSTSTFVQQEPTTTTTAARRQLPVLGREAFMLPHRSGNNADGMIEFNVIVIGGLDGHRQLLHRFVPSTGHWDVLSAMPEPRRRHSITALQQFVYVAGGKDMQSLKIVDNFWCFDTITRTWSAERSLLEPRAHFGLVTAHQCIYALGGQSATGKALSSVHCYDPVIKIWQEIRPMIHARMGAAYARHLNLIVAAGGKNDRGEVLSSVECYDLIAERWQAMPDLTEPRFGACICSVGDSLYVSGGTSNGENRPALSVDVLDCAQSKCVWQLVDCMEEPRTNHGAIVIGSQILLIGGERGGLNHLEGDTIKALCTERRAWIGGFRPLRSSLRGSVDSVLLLVDNNDNIG